MTRAEERALKAYPVRIDPTTCDCDLNEEARDIYQLGYEQAEKDIITIVKDYVEKGFRCMEQSNKFQMHTFWDGFHNCAENILRELEDEK